MHQNPSPLETTEEWRPIKGFGRYEVSSLGRVRSAKQVLRSTLHNDGYLFVGLYRDGTWKQAQRRINVLVCEAFNGPKPFPEALALHRDGDRQNNTPNNLYWGNDQQNMDDRRRHGRYYTRLTWDVVREARSRFRAGETGYRIALDMDLGVGVCYQIIRNEIWRETL